MDPFMHAISFIGSAGFYLPLLVLAFWCVNPQAAARGAVAIAASAMLNVLLKLAFADPRPYWTDPTVEALSSESSFGMPSGHAQGAMVAWGYLAYRLGRRWAWAASGVIIVLVGVSRVHLGVHSAGQVLAGWTVGALVLVAAVRLEPALTRWWCCRHVASQFALSAAVGVGLLGCTALVVETTLDDWRMPLAWRRAILAAGGTVDEVGLERAAMSAGVLCGVLAGLSWLVSRGWFDPSGPPLRRAARVLVGLAAPTPIVVVGAVLPDHPVTAFAALVLAGLWLTGGAPEAFVRLGLARRPTPALPRPGEPALTKDS